MSVERICNRRIVLARTNETALDAAQRMHEHNVGSLIVINDLQQPIGILTDRDLVTRVMAASRPADRTPVGDVMTKHPQTVLEETPIEEAVNTMRNGGFRRIPVVGPCQRLVGVVSLDDVLGLLAEEFTRIGGLLAPASHTETQRKSGGGKNDLQAAV